jgi:hypothetical protein
MRYVIAVGFVFTCVASLNAQEQTGTIVFYREPRMATGEFKPTIFCDKTELARLENGTSFQITAPTGVHICTAESLQRPTIEVNVLAGRTAYVHLELQPSFAKQHAVLVNTTEDEYNKQKARLKPLKEWSRDSLRTGPPPESTDSAESSRASTKKPVGTKDRHSGKFGDLVVTVSKLAINATNIQDRDEVGAFVRVANTGKAVVCATFDVTLNTTFALQYRGFTGGTQASHNGAGYPPAPSMNEMLPGESADGSYVFEIKHGVAPLELVIKLTSRRFGIGQSEASIRCGSNNPLRDIFVPNEIRLDVQDFLVTEQPSPR